MPPNKETIGKLTPKYSFVLNKYSDYRVSKCPDCDFNTFKRKFPLVIFVTKGVPITLGLTCTYCSKCELIIAHQHELEEELYKIFIEIDPEMIGNEYYVVGTVDKKIWKKTIGKKSNFTQMLEHAADFKEVLELKYQPAGWYRPK
ncbi:hypothetical protein H8E88_18390 [candidate division KSB1 bacterium]|nr:hypothetical protein [candidate division KSB1 bacterium]MBL7092961.1 hypothetical protein [candidate division KSB1 bacterium]